jgi:16S rRNA (guanine527-N7)-methyltransferase
MAAGRLVDVLSRSRSLGFLGPGSVRVHIEHAKGFAATSDGTPERFADLGSGGGVPGLVLALHWEKAQAALLEAGERRCAFLRDASVDLGITERVAVVHGRAEDLGRRFELRGRFDLVVARGFGPPPVTAECGAPLLQVGGTMVVSEPPEADGPDDGARGPRWPEAGLARLGLVAGPTIEQPYHYQVLLQERLCPAEYPRRVGVPAKRPLF